MTRIHNLNLSRFFSVLFVAGLAVLPMLAQDDDTSGDVHPPFRLREQPFTAAPTGLSPANIRGAYGFTAIANQGAGQTVAIVDAYDDPNIESDLNVFSSQFGLPACTTANGCFKKVYAGGTKPRTNSGWALEISLDVEWVHAIAPQAKILLVEGTTNSFNDLFAAANVAVNQGATVVSMSFGGGESSSQLSQDTNFNIPFVTFVASSGDSGNGAGYPAASPYVVSVGGTKLTLSGNSYVSETAWSGSGGGISGFESEPFFQSAYPIPNTGNKRGIPDVAYNGDPASGVSVYDSVPYHRQSGWFVIGGTSAGAPQWAALLGIVNSLRAASAKASLSTAGDKIYTAAKSAYSTNFHDITTGSNGSCGTVCTAAVNYDFVTGLGSPKANALIPALVAAP